MMLNADVRKRGEGVGQMWTPADRGRMGYEKGSFFADSFMDDPMPC